MRPLAHPMCLGALLALGCSASVDSVSSDTQPGGTVAASAPVSQTEIASKDQPTGALLDVGRSPLAALVESKLLEGKAKWLERSEIDKILAEQKLQAAFAAEAGQERIRLGRLLKADVLAILRTQEQEKPPRVELVVAETAGGLRLAAQSVFLSGRTDADAAAIVETIHEALKKYGQKIEEVYAIPPLASQDLTYEHEHLRAAYAKLIEQTLLEQPGALAVELAEAEALAREYGLAAAGDKPRRRLPVYVLGEYRHEGRGEELRVTIALRAKRGEQQILEARETLRPAEAPAFLKRAAARLIQGAGAQPPKTDPAAEARQLAEQARAVLRRGNWHEALRLLESSVLVDPGPLERRQELLHVYELLLGPRNPLEIEAAEAWREILGRRQRAVQLLESIFASETDLEKLLRSADFLKRGPIGAEPFFYIPAEFRKPFRELREVEHSLAMRLFHRLAEQEQWRASADWLRAALEDRSPRERYAERARMVLQHQNARYPHEVVQAFVALPGAAQHLDSFEGQQFLADLLASPQLNAAVRKAVEEIQAECKKGAAKRFAGAPAKVSPTPPKGASGLSFLPIEITCPFADGSTGKAELRDPQGFWLALDSGIDVFTAGSSLFAIHEKGRARRLWRTPLTNTRLTSLADDGRYLWMVVGTYGQTPQVWVFEPATDKSWQITAEHGLPLQPPEHARLGQMVMASPVAPGRAILAGGFGRSWVADVRIDPAGKHQVKVFHEARDVPDPRDYSTRRGPSVAFFPRSMFTFFAAAADGAVQQRVLIQRDQPRIGALVIDPEKPAVERMEESFSAWEGACLYQGALYYTGPGPQRTTTALLRCALPDLKPTVVLDNVPHGHVVIHKNALHVVGKQWWRGSLAQKRLDCAGDVPWTESSKASRADYTVTKVAASNHYGIIAAYRKGPPYSYELAQVVFDAPPGHVVRGGPAAGTSAPPARRPSLSLESLRPGPKPDESRRLWRDMNVGTPMACSPNGKLVITTGSAAQVQAWSGEDGRLLGNLVGSSPQMGPVAFSGDGRFFATATTRGDVVLWSAAELKPVRILAGHEGQLAHVAFSRDGRWLAACGWDGILHVWNTETREEILNTAGMPTRVEQILFLPDGKRLLTGDHSEVLVWDVESRSPPLRLEALRSFAGLLPDGAVLGTADDGTLSLVAWDPQTHALRRIWEETPGEPVAVSPDGRYVVLRRDEGVFRDGHMVNRVSPVHLHEVATGREIPIGDYSYVPDRAVFSADGKRLATTTSSGGGLRWWDLQPQTADAAQPAGGPGKPAPPPAAEPAEQPRSAAAEPSPEGAPPAEAKPEMIGRSDRLFTDLLFSPGGKTIVTASFDRFGQRPGVQAWSHPDGRLLADRPQPGRVTLIVFSRSGKLLATGDREGRVVVWSTEGLKPMHRLTGHDMEITGLAFSWDDKQLASSDRRDTLHVWNVSSGKEQYRVLDTKMSLGRVGFTADGSRLIGSSQSGEVLTLESRTGRPAGRIESLKRLIDFLPDKSLVATDTQGNLVAWDFATGTARTLWERFSGAPLGVSGDGRWIAVFGGETPAGPARTPFTHLRVHDLKTRNERVKTVVAMRPQCSFSPDGKFFVAVDQSGVFWTWDLEKFVPFAVSPLPAAGAEEAMQGFGKPVDPDGDCTVSVASRVLSMTVPGSLHDLSPEKNKMNAPRVLRDAEGDFVVHVCVDAALEPKEGRSQSAGLLVMQDERNYVRFEFVAEGPGGAGKPGTSMRVEVRQNGVVPANGTITGASPVRLRYLRIERHGRVVGAYCSPNKGQWWILARRIVPLPAGLKIGVTASNQSDSPFTAKFYDFQFLDQR